MSVLQQQTAATYFSRQLHFFIAFQLVNNPLGSARTKRIDVRYHFLRNMAREGRIPIREVSLGGQHVDILSLWALSFSGGTGIF